MVIVGGAAIGLTGLALSDGGRSSVNPRTGEYTAVEDPGRYAPADTILEIMGGIVVVGGLKLMIQGVDEAEKQEKI